MPNSQVVDAVETLLLVAIAEYEGSTGSRLPAATFTYPGHGLNELDRMMIDAIRKYESTTGVMLTSVVFTYRRPEFGVPMYNCEAR